MGPYMAYWLIGLTPIAVVVLLGLLLPSFARGYWANWRRWAPAMGIGAAFLVADGIFSAAIGFWEFTPERFTPGRFLNLPWAEWMFFVSAVFGVRLVWYVAEDALPGVIAWLRESIANRKQLLFLWLSTVVLSVLWGLVNHDHARTMYVFVLGFPMALLLSMATHEFWTRQTQAYIGLGFLLFLPMDTLMNGLGSFDHAEGLKSGVELPFGVPIEDIAYILVVLLLLRFIVAAYVSLTNRLRSRVRV